jgi:hypothetical protein
MIDRIFEEIWNDGKNCDKCRWARRNFYFKKHRKKNELFVKCLENEKTKFGTDFCPPYPGFINPNFVSEPESLPGKCVLFILESLGGGRKWPLKSESTVEVVVNTLQEYYLTAELRSFHQFCIRNLLFPFSKIPYVVTDTIKCYCKKTDENFGEAINHCSKFLRKQLNGYRPKVVVPIGNWARKSLSRFLQSEDAEEIEQLRHGEFIETVDIKKTEWFNNNHFCGLLQVSWYKNR